MILVAREFPRMSCAKLVVIIVTYGNPHDLERCLRSIGQSTWTDCDIFVTENAGEEAFDKLIGILSQEDGLLELLELSSIASDVQSRRFTVLKTGLLRESSIRVWLGVTIENLGYGGGVNAWLKPLSNIPGWEFALILNPDTELSKESLSELVALTGDGFDMVGSVLVYDDSPECIFNYGLHWSRVSGRTIGLGNGSLIEAAPCEPKVHNIDAPSGACTLVTRQFVENVGFMPEKYFLYMEDLEWGWMRGAYRIGVAPRAIVKHVGSASIGGGGAPARRSPISVYLAARNSMLFSRRWAGWWLPFHVLTGLLFVIRYMMHGAFRNAAVALAGMIDGFIGRSGRPELSFLWDVGYSKQQKCASNQELDETTGR